MRQPPSSFMALHYTPTAPCYPGGRRPNTTAGVAPEPPRVRWRRWGRDHPPSAQTPRATPQRPPDPPSGVDLGARPAFGLERRVRPSLDTPGPGPTGRADPVTSPRWVCLAVGVGARGVAASPTSRYGVGRYPEGRQRRHM